MWKHAITSSDDNTEFKVWCCATWDCLQTVRFTATDDAAMCFNAEIDPTSSYLVLADTKHRCLYALQINKSDEDEDAKTESNTANGTKSVAFIKSISEFPVSSPILSFSIVDASVRKFKCPYDDVYLLGELEDYDDDPVNRYCVVIHMFSVQPRSVQECQVLFQPSLSLDAHVGSTLSALTDGKAALEDLSSEIDSNKERAADKVDLSSVVSLSGILPVKGLLEQTALSDSSSPQIKLADITVMNEEKSASQQLLNKSINLLTPDSFQTTGKTTPEGVSNEVYTALRMLAGESKPKELPAVLLQPKLIPVDACDGAKIKDKEVVKEDEEHESKVIENDDEKIPLLTSDDTEDGQDEVVPHVAGNASAGSSPSREVQEILSQKDSDLNDNSNTSADTQDDDSDASGNNGETLDGNDDEKNSDSNGADYTLLNNGKFFVKLATGFHIPNKFIFR